MLFALLNILTALAAFWKKKKIPKLSVFPGVTIICRTWEDDHVVERFIKRCLAQNYKGNLQIIIADDASTDKTESICKKYEKAITYVKAKKHHKWKALFLNKIIKTKVKGDILINTDIDAVFSKNYVTEMVCCLQKNDAVSSACIGGNTGTLISKVRTIEDFWIFCTGMKGRNNLTNQAAIFGGSHGIWMQVLKNVGYYGEKTITEDSELTTVLNERSYKTGFCDNTIVLLEDVETFKQYVNERKRWIDGGIKTAEAYKGGLNIHNLLFVVNYSLSITSLLSLISFYFNPIFAIPFTLNIFTQILSLYQFKAKLQVYSWLPLYTLIDPILMSTTFALTLWDNLIYKRVKWVKVSGKKYHLGRKLKKVFK